MKKIINNLSGFVKKYSLFFLLFFAIANMFNYVFVALNSDTNAGMIYRCIILFVYILFFALSCLYTDIVANRYFIIISAIYLFFSICSLINITFNPLTSYVSINTIHYIKSLGQIVINICSLILLFTLQKHDLKMKSLLSFIILGIVFIMVVFSIIKDYEAIVNTFINNDHSNYDVTSFFVDKNTFGLFLFAGSAVSYYLFKKKSFWFIIPNVFLLVYALIARCKTSAVLILIILITSFVEYLIFLFKSNKKVFYAVLSSVLITFVTFLILVLTRVGPFDYVYSVIFGQYGLFYDSVVVIVDRYDNWTQTIHHLNKFSFITLGYSERIYQLFVTNPIDNIFIHSLISGGVIKLLLYCFVQFLLLKSNIKNRNAFFMLCLFVLYGTMQDYTIIGISVSSLLFTIIYLLYRENDCKHQHPSSNRA